MAKINATNMTIADCLKKNDKVLIGIYTYTKKCDSMNHCFVAKCLHGQSIKTHHTTRRCTIYKNLASINKK